MAYRLTDTNKWDDKWFLDLRPIEKLLFYYLCDNCDCAGFIEINIRKWTSEIGYTSKELEGALKGLTRGFIYSSDKTCIWLKKFLKHQKHVPLKENDNAYKGIASRFENYKYKFDILSIDEFITRGLQGASEGLPRGNGNGNGNGNDYSLRESNNNTITKDKTWKNDFEVYKSELKQAFIEIVNPEYISEREKYHSGLDILKTLQKSCKDFWVTESGWKNKKSKKTVKIDWKATFNAALSQKVNQVWKPKIQQNEIKSQAQQTIFK